MPKKYEYIVLTNLAGLLYKTGALDEALTLMKDSISINDKDPDSNFFLANLYSAKGNMTGALHHYKLSLAMRPDFAPAWQFIHVPACDLKFKKPNKVSSSCQSSSECMSKMDKAGETMIFCKEGHCRSVTTEEFLAASLSTEAKLVEDIGKQRGKLRKKKKKKKEQEVFLDEGMLPKAGEETVLLEHSQVKKVLPLGAVEIGTVAETLYDEDEEDSEDHDEDLELLVHVQDEHHDENAFIGPVNLIDDPIPDIMIKVREKLATPQPTSEECKSSGTIKWDSFTSTWLSVSAKNIDIREYMGDYLEPIPDSYLKTRPFCPEVKKEHEKSRVMNPSHVLHYRSLLHSLALTIWSESERGSIFM